MNTLPLSTRTKCLIKIKKEQRKISRKRKRERIISQNIIKTIENLHPEEVIAMNTKRIKSAISEMTFHEKLKIKKFWSLKKNVFKNNMQHKFAVTNSYGDEQIESNIIKTEYEKEFQQRLVSRQITEKYRNIKEITDKIFDTCSSVSKVQNNQTEITKDEVQSAIKTQMHTNVMIQLFLQMKF